MHHFETELVHGDKAPYDTWTFVVVPQGVFDALGKAKPPVRGTIDGEAFRETVNRSGGVPRMLVRRELLDAVGAAVGDTVDVRLELDPEPRTFDVPPELEAVLDDDPRLAELYADASPSMRRAWATYVDEAKRPDTRVRRAEKARNGLRDKLYPNQSRPTRAGCSPSSSRAPARRPACPCSAPSASAGSRRPRPARRRRRL